MISDDQIMKTQTCFLQEMAQKERIQPSTVDLVHLVPFCLSLQGVLLVVARVEPSHLGPPQCFCLEDFTKFCLFDSIEL